MFTRNTPLARPGEVSSGRSRKRESSNGPDSYVQVARQRQLGQLEDALAAEQRVVEASAANKGFDIVPVWSSAGGAVGVGVEESDEFARSVEAEMLMRGEFGSLLEKYGPSPSGETGGVSAQLFHYRKKRGLNAVERELQATSA